MAYGVGIDTGGTYTDAVVCDLETGHVLAAGKSPTTRQDLSLGIGRALDMLPAELLRQARVAALSTTLATNACVENRGGRARLVLMGATRKTLEWIGADKKYGLNYDDVLCLDTKGSFDGTVVDHPDWPGVMEENDAFLSGAQSLAVAEMNATRNGGVCETAARDALGERYNVPIVLASELVGGLNMMERGATGLLNARLLPVVDQFMKAVRAAFEARGLTAPRMIVRSDGSLMGEDMAKKRPVETILSGPAASVMGSRALAECENCLIVDMGGTTTDVSIVRGGEPFMSGGIRIGGWRTQVKGVFIDTFGLGGDTRLYMEGGALKLDSRRVEPICAAAARWPSVRDQLAQLLTQSRAHTRPLHEFLYLVHAPEHPEEYTPQERALMELLADGPQMIGGAAMDMYDMGSERLEREGLVMRCGLTPTDVMHIRGDYSAFDAEASRLAARFFLRSLPERVDDQPCMDALCEEAYDLVKRRLFENIARVFIEASYPGLCPDGLDGQLRAFIAHRWENRNAPEPEGFFNLRLDAQAALIGIGAPTHIFLPEVAQALGVRCVIPEHSGVANAVGAAMAQVAAKVTLEVSPIYTSEGVDGFGVHGPGVNERYDDYDCALEAAKAAAERIAIAEAVRRGASGPLDAKVTVNERMSRTRAGSELKLGTSVMAAALGHTDSALF